MKGMDTRSKSCPHPIREYWKGPFEGQSLQSWTQQVRRKTGKSSLTYSFGGRKGESEVEFDVNAEKTENQKIVERCQMK